MQSFEQDTQSNLAHDGKAYMSLVRLAFFLVLISRREVENGLDGMHWTRWKIGLFDEEYASQVSKKKRPSEQARVLCGVEC